MSASIAVESPGRYVRLLTLLKSGDLTSEAVHREVSKLPICAARLLALANQADQSGSMSIDRIDRAVMLLGRDAVVDEVEFLSSANDEEQGSHEEAIEHLVRHSYVVSRAAELMSHAARLPLHPQARAAGLLHDIGVFVLLRDCPTEFLSAMKDAARERASTVEYECLHCGRDHCEAGESMLRSWGIPDTLLAPIAFHHDPLAAPRRHRYTALLLYAAECLAVRAGYRETFGTRSLRLEKQVLSELQLADDVLRIHVPILRRLLGTRRQAPLGEARS